MGTRKREMRDRRRKGERERERGREEKEREGGERDEELRCLYQSVVSFGDVRETSQTIYWRRSKLQKQTDSLSDLLHTIIFKPQWNN